MNEGPQRKTPIELYRLGAAALDSALGSIENLCFFRLLNPAKAAYTEADIKICSMEARARGEECEACQ